MIKLEQERWKKTVSMATLLRVSHTKRLILVQDRETHGWGLPAGGLEKKERLVQGLRREVGQETNLEQERLHFNTRPHVVCLPGEDKTQLGLVFDGVYVNKRGHPQEWKVAGDKKVSRAKIFTVREIFPLLENSDRMVYKPWFNFPQLMRWVVELSDGRNGAPIGFLDDLLLNISRKVEGLTLEVAKDLRDYRKWRYVPPYEEYESTIDLWGNLLHILLPP